MMCIYPRSIKIKQNLEFHLEIMSREAKNASEAFFGLHFVKNCFLQFEVIFGYKGVKIVESVYFCIRIKKVKVN